MAVFATNQVTQLYVVNKVAEDITKEKDLGALVFRTGEDKDFFSFQHLGAGGIVGTDNVDVSNIKKITAVKAEDQKRFLDRFSIELDSTINGGLPVAGQEYLLRVNFREYIGFSPDDQYVKHGVVQAFPNMDASTFYKRLALSLVMNISRELTPLLTVYVNMDGAETEVTSQTKIEDLTGDVDKIIIEQAMQDWSLGLRSMKLIPFTASTDFITVEGFDAPWGIVTREKPTKSFGNGMDIADYEYFCMGERGDVYRNMGFPHVIPTKYLVDATKEYDVITIHFSHIGDGVHVQKSDRQMVLVSDSADSNAIMKAILAKIKTVTEVPTV